MFRKTTIHVITPSIAVGEERILDRYDPFNS